MTQAWRAYFEESSKLLNKLSKEGAT